MKKLHWRGCQRVLPSPDSNFFEYPRPFIFLLYTTALLRTSNTFPPIYKPIQVQLIKDLKRQVVVGIIIIWPFNQKNVSSALPLFFLSLVCATYFGDYATDHKLGELYLVLKTIQLKLNILCSCILILIFCPIRYKPKKKTNRTFYSKIWSMRSPLETMILSFFDIYIVIYWLKLVISYNSFS